MVFLFICCLHKCLRLFKQKILFLLLFCFRLCFFGLFVVYINVVDYLNEKSYFFFYFMFSFVCFFGLFVVYINVVDYLKKKSYFFFSSMFSFMLFWFICCLHKCLRLPKQKILFLLLFCFFF